MTSGHSAKALHECVGRRAREGAQGVLEPQTSPSLSPRTVGTTTKDCMLRPATMKSTQIGRMSARFWNRFSPGVAKLVPSEALTWQEAFPLN